ncbi:MAG: HDIG domain-containing metalloprotein [Methanoculleaceae archaeon]
MEWADRSFLRGLLWKAGCSEAVVAHCDAVTDFALEFTRSDVVDKDLIIAGAMLHDIGRGVDHGIAHAQIGAGICRRYGLPESVCRIVERHTGAGLSADECSLLGLSPRDCIPETIEEKIVAHADNLIKGTERSSIERRMLESPHLPRRTRLRIYRLARDVNLFRR